MTDISSVPITAGHLHGSAGWDSHIQSYVALLHLFDRQQAYPPPVAQHGVRTGEFLTPEALTNHLAGIGLEVDAATRAELDDLAGQVAAAEGEAEIVGLTDLWGGRHLLAVTPARLALRLNPRLEHRDYRLDWGDTGPCSVETARLICEQVWVRAPALDIDTFALAFTHEVLSTAGSDFSFSATSLCDWYLTDAEPRTSLDMGDLATLRRRHCELLRQPTPLM
jgi:hypothetical protein